MNIRNVLRTYSLLRQLTDDESALLETLRGATEAERQLLVETLSPQKMGTKRAGKKSSKGASKSSRASGMEATLKRSLEQQRQVTKSNDMDDGFCAACNVQIGHNVHHLESLPDYHPFQSKSDAVAHEAGTGG